MSEKKNVESILSELGKKIDSLIEETKRAGSKVSDETEKKINDLKKQKEKLEEQIKERTGDSGEKWSRAREHLNEAADAMRKAFEALLKKS